MVGCITRTPHRLPQDDGRGTRDGRTGRRGDGHNSKKISRASRASAVLRTLDISFEPWLKVNKRSERAATPLGAPQILSTGGQPNASELREMGQNLGRRDETRKSDVNIRMEDRNNTQQRPTNRPTENTNAQASTRVLPQHNRIKNNPPDPKGHGGKFFI